MAVTSKTSKRLTALITLLVGVMSLQACEGDRRADQVVYACFGREGDAGRAIGMLHELSNNFGYRFREYGDQSRDDLETIGADPVIIPAGVPIQADIENRRGDVVLIASNFGSVGEDLRIGFFHHQHEGSDAAFRQAVLASLRSMEGARLSFADSESPSDPCGHN